MVTACGGGGGGGDDAASGPAPVTPPVAPPAELFRLSGTITASSSQAVDGDTNDPGAIARPNDTVATAQALPNPITLGGYVNQPGTGAPGRSQVAGDVDDYYRVDLLAGQSVTMLVADFQQADADLYLFDTQGRILDFSIESGEVETLVIPQDGTYVVNAFAYEGATSYILAIGNQNTLSRQSRRHYDIVPWESVIKYRSGAEPEKGGLKPAHTRLRRMGMEQRAGGPGRARLMGMRRGHSGAAETLVRTGKSMEKLERVEDPGLKARLETLLAIKSLRRDPEIEYAEPNYRVRAMATPNDSGYPFQWHYPLIDLPAAWDTTTGDSQVIVAVVDTGILSRHPDLIGQWVDGYDFVSNTDRARDGDGIDPDPEDPGEGDSTASNSFHGTHVGGTVAAAGGNGIGVAGVAYGARIMPLRALGAGGAGTTYDVDQAVRFAAGLANDSGTLPDRPADIINMSIGGAPFSQSSQALYREVRAAGVVIVASAGNEASSTPSYPAAYDGVISVAAVDAQRRRASYSNSGSSIDLAAPGGDSGVDLNGDGYPDGVLSTGGLGSGSDFGYTFLSGTSMAAPHVAGVLALMKSVNPDLSPADFDALILRGDISDDLGSPGRDDLYGHGLVNAQRAVLAALAASGNIPADKPQLSVSAAALNFAGSVDELELELRNGGNGELDLLELSASEPWLQLSPLDVQDTGLGLYRVAVERSGLAVGVYSAEISARSSANTVTIRVIMSIGDAASADVGIVYILLYEQGAEEPIAQVIANSNGGRYDFAFSNVPGGQYQVFAGSDADNDLLICDAGEACGSWLTVDQPIVIELDSDLDSIDFPVDYLIAIPASDAVGQSARPDNSQAKPVSRRPVTRSP
ncbi:MAG: S8 family peptidase [Halieaceae bacterium]|jgi:serine protease|nr:S8 family peptidase [Halieaceae bacterium]